MVTLSKDKRYVVIVSEKKKKGRTNLYYHRNRFIDKGLVVANYRADFPIELREVHKNPIGQVYELSVTQKYNLINNTLHVYPEFNIQSKPVGKLENGQGILCDDLPSFCKCQSHKKVA